MSDDQRLFALRGAVKADANDVDAIVEATEELMRELMSRNELAPGAVRQLPLHRHRRSQRRVPRRRRAPPGARGRAPALHARARRPRRDASGDPRLAHYYAPARSRSRARVPRRAAERCAPTYTRPSDRHLRRQARADPRLSGRRAHGQGARGDRRPARSPSSPRTSRRSGRTRPWSRRSRARPPHEPLPGPGRDPAAPPDRRALRRRLGSIAVSNGSCEILLAAALALCEPGDEIVYAWPSFSMYPYLAPLSGAREIRVAARRGRRARPRRDARPRSPRRPRS